MKGFKLEINEAGYPIAGSFDDVGIQTFVQEFLNKPGFIDQMISDPNFLDYLTIKKTELRLFKSSPQKANQIILDHIDTHVLAHPFIEHLLKEANQVPIKPFKPFKHIIQVGGVVPYIAGVLVVSSVLYLFKRTAIATYKPLSTDERRWVITYNFNTFPNALQFVVKFSVDVYFIQKYRWEYNIYTKLHAKNNGSYMVENFYDWQERQIYVDESFEFNFTYKNKVYKHIENPENLMDSSFKSHLIRYGSLNTGALIGIYNPRHCPLSDINIIDIDAYIHILYIVVTNLNAAFTIGGLLHGDFKYDNVLIDIQTDEALIYDLDFSYIVPTPVNLQSTVDIQKINGIYHPTSVNYLFYNKTIPQKINVLFLHFFDIFFLAYSIHYNNTEFVNHLNYYLQKQYGRNQDFDIFLSCFNSLSQFRNTYKDPSDPNNPWEYLTHDKIIFINQSTVYPTNNNKFKVYSDNSITRSIIRDILSVQSGWNRYR